MYCGALTVNNLLTVLLKLVPCAADHGMILRLPLFDITMWFFRIAPPFPKNKSQAIVGSVTSRLQYIVSLHSHWKTVIAAKCCIPKAESCSGQCDCSNCACVRLPSCRLRFLRGAALQRLRCLARMVGMLYHAGFPYPASCRSCPHIYVPSLGYLATPPMSQSVDGSSPTFLIARFRTPYNRF